MLLSAWLDLKRIEQCGRDYRWPRPAQCQCGHRKVWGHGFLLMCFAGIAQPLDVRRDRCPVCGYVIRLRPKGHYPIVLTDSATVRCCLGQRIQTGCWLQAVPGNRARHWFAVLKRNATVILDFTWCKQGPDGRLRSAGSPWPRACAHSW